MIPDSIHLRGRTNEGKKDQSFRPSLPRFYSCKKIRRPHRSIFLFFIIQIIFAAMLHAQPETVVLLHGLGRSGASMVRLERALTASGFRVVNLSYDSRTIPLETLARDWLPAQLRTNVSDPATRLHFVTHSMGGILLRLYLREHPEARVHRVVMIAPPNQGSEVSARLKNFPPFRWLTGVNGVRLDPAPASLPRALGPWPGTRGELGVIAGNFSFNPIFSAWLGGPDDGKVAVTSTHLTGETAHIVLPYSHTWLPARAETAKRAVRFLRNGNF